MSSYSIFSYNEQEVHKMAIDQFIKDNDYPEVKKLGKLNGWTYYIDKTLKDNEEVGVPMMLKEKGSIIQACDADESLQMIEMFYSEEK